LQGGGVVGLTVTKGAVLADIGSRSGKSEGEKQEDGIKLHILTVTSSMDETYSYPQRSGLRQTLRLGVGESQIGEEQERRPQLCLKLDASTHFARINTAVRPISILFAADLIRHICG
jgi:hypothetical protein